MQAIKLLLDRVASLDVTMHEIEGGAHELFIGLERDQVGHPPVLRGDCLHYLVEWNWKAVLIIGNPLLLEIPLEWRL